MHYEKVMLDRIPFKSHACLRLYTCGPYEHMNNTLQMYINILQSFVNIYLLTVK